MRRGVDIKTADEIVEGDLILVPQGGIGILMPREVKGTATVDGGKWIEIEADNGVKHLVGKADRVVVVF